MPYITPDEIPDDYVVRRLVIPNDTKFLGALNGALLTLTYEKFWENPDGGILPEEAAALAQTMVDKYWDIPMNIGAVIQFASTAPPEGCLACDGATYSKDDYPELYAVLDAAFIVDADNFTVPNLSPVSGLSFCIIAK